MPVLDGKGLQWFASLVKKYIGIPWTLSNENDTAIVSNDNLNNYNTIGNYYCSTGSIASTVQNSPTKNAFILKVYSAAGNSTEYLTQCVEDQYNALWRRYKYSSLGEWGDWFRFPITDDSSVGGETNPIYVENGKFVASTTNLGSGKNPLYLDGGSLTASKETVGADDTPIYLNGGVFTACSTVAGTGGVKEYRLGESGYVRYDFGLIIQWGTMSTTADRYNSTSGNYTVTFPIAFSTSSSYIIVKSIACSGNTTVDHRMFGFFNKTATQATTYYYHGSSLRNEEWLAIGY